MYLSEPLNSSREGEEPLKEEPIEDPKDYTPWTLALLDIFDKSRTGPSMVYINNAENLFKKKPRIPSAFRKQEAERMRKDYNTFKPNDFEEYSHISDEFLYQPENLILGKELHQEHNPLEPARRETGGSALTSPQEHSRFLNHETKLIKLRRKSDSSKMAGGISKLELKVQYLPDEVKFIVHHEELHPNKKKDLRSMRDLKAFRQQNSKGNLFDAGSLFRKVAMIDKMHARATSMVMEKMMNNHNKHREGSEAQLTPHRIAHFHDSTPGGGLSEKTPQAGDDTSKHSQNAVKLSNRYRESLLSLIKSRPGSTSPAPSITTEEKEKFPPPEPKDDLKNEVIESESEPVSPELKKDLAGSKKVSAFHIESPTRIHKQISYSPDKSPIEICKSLSPIANKKNSLKPYRIMSEKDKLPIITRSVSTKSRLQPGNTYPIKGSTPYNFQGSASQEPSEEFRFSIENSLERVENHTDLKIKKKKKIKRSQIYKRTIHENIKKIPEVYMNPIASVNSTTNKNVTVFLFDKKTFSNFKPFKYKPMGDPTKLIEVLNKPMTPLSRLSTPFNRTATTPLKPLTPMKGLEPFDRRLNATAELRPKRPENAQNKRLKLFNSASETNLQRTNNIAVF